MTYSFVLDKKSFGRHLKLFSSLEDLLHSGHVVSSAHEYNEMLQKIIVLLKKEKFTTSSSLFTKEAKQLMIVSPLIEKTPWGGVSIKKVDTAKNFVQKLLLVKQYGILGFEIHKKKLEKLRVLEGICLFIASQHKKKGWTKGSIIISLGRARSKVIFEPKDEHGIIALTNCVIEEASTNNLDDLFYIFPASQVK